MPWAIRTLLTISLIALPLFLYVGLRLAASVAILRKKGKGYSRKTVLIALGCLYCFPAILLAMQFAGHSGTLLMLEGGKVVDYLFLYPFWISLIMLIEALAPMLIIDIAALISRAVPSWRGRLQGTFAALRLVVAFVAIVYVPIRSVIDTTRVQDDEVDVHPRNLPAELRNFRITLIGDIHIDRFTDASKIGQVSGIIRDRKPQLLLSSGDVVSGGREYLDEAKNTIRSLRGSVASIAVMGDHDYWSAPDAVRSLYMNGGWTFLENSNTVITWKGKKILVTGLTHIYSQRLNEAALRRILEDRPEADLKILLVHQPAEWLIQEASDRGYDIVVAGHTHGGQIVLHPLGIPLTASMRETRYYSGMYTYDSTTIVVTRGIGLTLAPVRYHAGAEVTTIVLR
jgi:uncharacterized protein